MNKPSKEEPTPTPKQDKPQSPPEPENPVPKNIMVKEGCESGGTKKTSERKK